MLVHSILAEQDTKAVGSYSQPHLIINLSAAFDTLDHSILLDRLFSRFGINGSALAWFKSYLSGRTQQVLVHDEMSPRVPLKVSVPQGSVLGPILFNAYTAPLADIFEFNGLSFHCYSDDSQLYIVCRVKQLERAISSVNSCIVDVQGWMVPM